MATLPKMIQAFKPLDGRDEATLTQHGRVLREAGLIPGGKRGVGAPHMTARHTAILLLGIYGSATPKDAPEAVDRIGDLRHHFTDGLLHEIFDRFVGVTFLDTLENMIARAPEIVGFLFKIVKENQDWTEDQLNLHVQQMQRGGGLIDMTVEIGGTAARIKAKWGDDELLDSIFMVDGDRFMAGEYNARINADRKVTVSFSLRTIAALYEAMAGDVIQLGDEG